jgi:CubicO group peptidase (beta-lactamase class C family)
MHDSNLSPLPRSAPEAQGVSSKALLAFVEAADSDIRDLHSLMLLRHGQVVAEGWWSPYAPEHPHVLFSLSKSFASTAAGLAIAEGRLSLGDTVLSFFPEDAPAQVGEHLAAMRVWHLLSMSTGHAEDTTRYLHEAPDGNWARAFLARPVEHTPGTHFVYNSGATYMVSAIVERVTGIGLLAYLEPRLLAPLGITGATWETCPRGIAVGGWGLKIKTEDIARFGQLYLQKGVWNGVRLLAESWVEEATSHQVDNGDRPDSDWNQGYGFQFWRCRHGAYRGDGAFGQYCVVLPEQEAVLAITAGTGDMQAVLNLVWQHLLPGFAPAPLPADEAVHTALRERLAGLNLPVPHGAPTSPLAEAVSGKTYRFPTTNSINEAQIETLRLDFGDEGNALQVRVGQTEHSILFGTGGTRVCGLTAFDVPSQQARPVAATGAWQEDDTFVVQLCHYETPFYTTLTCRFVQDRHQADRLQLDSRLNVSFGPTERPQIEGQAA